MCLCHLTRTERVKDKSHDLFLVINRLFLMFNFFIRKFSKLFGACIFLFHESYNLFYAYISLLHSNILFLFPLKAQHFHSEAIEYLSTKTRIFVLTEHLQIMTL